MVPLICRGQPFQSIDQTQFWLQKGTLKCCYCSEAVLLTAGTTLNHPICWWQWNGYIGGAMCDNKSVSYDLIWLCPMLSTRSVVIPASVGSQNRGSLGSNQPCRESLLGGWEQAPATVFAVWMRFLETDSQVTLSRNFTPPRSLSWFPLRSTCMASNTKKAGRNQFAL